MHSKKYNFYVENILKIPHGYDLVAIENNKMILAKKDTIFKYKESYYKRNLAND